METIRNNLKSAISNLYSKKFFKNYDNLDLTGVNRDFFQEILKITLKEILSNSISEVGQKKLTRALLNHFNSLSDLVTGTDFSKFLEIKRLARGEARVYQIRKGSLKEIKDSLLKDLVQVSLVEKSLKVEEVLEIFTYVAENIIFQKVTLEKKSSSGFKDPSLEELVVDFWNDYYGVRYEELSIQDFDFTQINEKISAALGESYKDLLSASELYIEYHIEPSSITIKSINGVILFEPVTVSNSNPRNKKRTFNSAFENIG